jgi:hypothetical protein
VVKLKEWIVWGTIDQMGRQAWVVLDWPDQQGCPSMPSLTPTTSVNIRPHKFYLVVTRASISRIIAFKSKYIIYFSSPTSTVSLPKVSICDSTTLSCQNCHDDTKAPQAHSTKLAAAGALGKT